MQVVRHTPRQGKEHARRAYSVGRSRRLLLRISDRVRSRQYLSLSIHICGKALPQQSSGFDLSLIPGTRVIWIRTRNRRRKKSVSRICRANAPQSLALYCTVTALKCNSLIISGEREWNRTLVWGRARDESVRLPNCRFSRTFRTIAGVKPPPPSREFQVAYL
jgi:hypothetical protein